MLLLLYALARGLLCQLAVTTYIARPKLIDRYGDKSQCGVCCVFRGGLRRRRPEAIRRQLVRHFSSQLRNKRHQCTDLSRREVRRIVGKQSFIAPAFCVFQYLQQRIDMPKHGDNVVPLMLTEKDAILRACHTVPPSITSARSLAATADSDACRVASKCPGITHEPARMKQKDVSRHTFFRDLIPSIRASRRET